MNKVSKSVILIIFTALCASLLWDSRKSFYYPVTLSINLKSDQPDKCQVFYDAGRGFNEQQSMVKQLGGGGDFEMITFDLPLTSLGSFRIDPGMGSKNYQIQKIVIRVGEQVESYTGADIPEHFELTHLALADSLQEGSLMLKMIDNHDVQMQFKHPLPEIFVMENLTAKRNWFGRIIAFYLIFSLTLLFFGNRIYSGLKRWLYSVYHSRLLVTKSDYLKRYIYENRILIIFSLLIAVFSYGYELFNFTLSIDDEIDSLRNAREIVRYVMVGRWGLYYLNQLFVPHSVIPYYTTLLALCFISASTVLFLSGIKGSTMAKLVFSIVFISHPLHSYYLAFNNPGVYYSFGMVLITLSYLSFKAAVELNESRLKYYVFSIILLGLALSIYQALLAFFVVFIAYYLFNNVTQKPGLTPRKILGIVISLLAVTGIGFLFYKIGDITARHFILEPKGMNQTKYLEGFISWGRSPVSEVIDHLIQGTKEYLLGIGKIGSEVGLSIKATTVLGLLMLYFILKETPGYLKKLVAIFFLIVLILSPFTVMYLNGLQLPARALMSVSLMIAILWLITFRKAGYFLRKIMIIAVFFILINNTYINTRMFYSTYVSWQADRDMANRMIERIYNLDPPSVNGHIQVFFVGKHEHESNALFFKSNVHGASFFEWSPEEQYRIISLFRTIGIEELNAVSSEEIVPFKNEIEEMPSWPSKGAVRLMDKVVVVKLSNPVY